MNEKQAYLLDEFRKVKIALTEQQAGQFVRYYELLTEWNRVMNLTAITEFSEVVRKHFVDSVLLADYIRQTQPSSLIDIGTGAGFPGIPLKILFPKLRVTLLDSLNKRIRFLDAVILALGLTEIETIHGRAEEYGMKDAYREQYDLCVSRAVARLASLCEFCIPFVKKSGAFVAYKAAKSEEELLEAKAAIATLGAKLDAVKEFKLSEDTARTLLVLKKTSNTPPKYPRQGGKPLKEPIGVGRKER